MTQAAATPSMFSVFRNRRFALLWTAQLVSTIGSSLTDLAAAIYVFRVTGSALNVGLTLMVTAIPTLFVGLFAGVFVDRFDRKRILQASDLLRGLLVLTIPFLVVDTGNIVVLYVILFCAAIVRQFFDPAWESVLPEIASEEELARANSFLSISSFGSTAIGFAAAGFLAGVDIHLPFFIDAATFLFSFACVTLVRLPKHADAADESTSVRVIVSNLRDGVRTLVQIPLLRSLLVAGMLVNVSFGLWNVLLLPMAIKALNATEAEYGLQEGLTSVGFAVAALLMAKYLDRLPEVEWMTAGIVGMGIFGVLYGLAPNIQLAIVYVMCTGFLNAPFGIARRTLMQRNIPRVMRGRVFSAFFVTRDVLFLMGMAGAGLADIFPVRDLIVVASVILMGAGALHAVLPGLRRPATEWRRALQLLRTAPAAPTLAAGRPATMLDLDRLIDVLPELGALAMPRRSAFLEGATLHRADAGTAIMKQGDPGDSAYFVLGGKAVAGLAEGSGYRTLSSMGPGDFFGEIAVLTGSPRTVNIVAEEPMELVRVPGPTLKSLMTVPALEQLINSKLSERLTRTANADLIRLAGLDQRDLRDLRRRRSRRATPESAPAPAGGGSV
ncbi:MAG TPA: MFS transporter [Candidatus Limnocylindrales bacterium]|nr:MFS transporter [Candidatus Limnocylindrales bacterium]